MDKNKELHEKFFPDECWHEFINGFVCKCGKHLSEFLPSQAINPHCDSDPVAYWRLMEKVMQHEKYTYFLEYVRKQWVADELSKEWPYSKWLLRLFFDMPRGTDAIHGFFCSN